ncbi:META domain-containing protein [Agromyces sp. MMS24-K17]|uniref:META domain-containing protein n=1 Tax=Agromyces sp. MMS24-K17 TaxID=3372850 RepID=UPI0037553406
MGARGIIIGVGAIVAAIALSGCAGGSGGGTVDPVGTWGDPSAGEPYLALAEGGGLSGYDGCNRLTGTWEVDASDHVDFEIASTRMACEGVDDWLSRADEATVSDDTMSVIADDGAQIGTLKRTSDQPETAAPSATPSPSDSAGAAAGAEAFIGTWGTADAQQPHLIIVADGTMSGSDGCNQLAGGWELDDDGSIEFDDVASTLMACEGGDQTLGQLDSATVSGDTLTVIDDHGTVLATLPRTA